MLASPERGRTDSTNGELGPPSCGEISSCRSVVWPATWQGRSGLARAVQRATYGICLLRACPGPWVRGRLAQGLPNRRVDSRGAYASLVDGGAVIYEGGSFPETVLCGAEVHPPMPLPRVSEGEGVRGRLRWRVRTKSPGGSLAGTRRGPRNRNAWLEGAVMPPLWGKIAHESTERPPMCEEGRSWEHGEVPEIRKAWLGGAVMPNA